jgi:uncharacterized protein (TIRG00374 family)
MNNSNYLKKSVNWKLWLGLVISALFLFLAFREVDLRRLGESIFSANPNYLALVVIATFFQFIVRSWRWRIFLKPLKNTTFSNRFSSILIGFAANCVLPARLGEFIRANYLGKREGIRGGSAFGTLVVERLFDGFTMLVILLISLIGTPFPDEFQSISGTLRTSGLVVFLSCLLIIVVLIGFKYRTDTFIKFIQRILFFLSRRFRSRIIDIVRHFSMGLVLMKDIQGWAMAIFYSIIIWFLSLCQIQLIESSLGFSLPFITAFLIMTMAFFGVMIPSSPGYIGTFHLAVQYGFLFHGVAREKALSAAILWHASFFFPTILFGLLAFLWLQIPRARDLKRSPSGVETTGQR